MGQSGERSYREINPAMEMTVIKRNPLGQETWRYHGRVVARSADQVILEAYFDRDDLNLHGLVLGRGDRFLETWYTNRWYNIFEIHAREDDSLRGWYCNIGRPAEIEQAIISYIDLCLDLVIFPDGRQVILDEAEFDALDISPTERQQARLALTELQTQFTQLDQGKP